jgi:hypothetical protein
MGRIKDRLEEHEFMPRMKKEATAQVGHEGENNVVIVTPYCRFCWPMDCGCFL